MTATRLWLRTLAAEVRGCRVLGAQPAESETKLSYAALASVSGSNQALRPSVTRFAASSSLCASPSRRPS